MKIALYLGFFFFTYLFILFRNSKIVIIEYFKGDYSKITPENLESIKNTLIKMKGNGLSEEQCQKNFIGWANTLIFFSALLGLACLTCALIVN